jgi:hypothetical protein
MDSAQGWVFVQNNFNPSLATVLLPLLCRRGVLDHPPSRMMVNGCGSEANVTSRHVLIQNADRAFAVDRDQLRYAALGHGDAEQSIHPRHRDRVVSDDDEARLGR